MKNVGVEALELGLFMIEEMDPTEEEAHIFCFRHFLLLEFVAEKYVATLTKVSYSNRKRYFETQY